MQKYIDKFSTKSNRIKIVNNQNSEIRDLLIESAVMITDYSSVGMDFAYMKKPVIYYQFDEKKFREAQYQKGYFDYRKSGLGHVCNNCDEVVKLVENLYSTNFEITEQFEKAHKNFFELYDNKNNERIFNAIKKI